MKSNVPKNSKTRNSLKLGLLRSDLDQILEENSGEFATLSKKKILILGGTGFVGSWLSKSIIHFISNGGVCEITIAARNLDTAHSVYSESDVKPILVSLDIVRDSIANIEQYDLIINCATPSTVTIQSSDIKDLYTTITEGTRNLVKQLSSIDKNIRVLNLSSGAVTVLNEKEGGSKSENCPNSHMSTASSAYSHGKRIAEEIFCNATAEGIISGVNLRLYAFLGPGLPLDQHFAVGNFISDALQNRKISILGNPNTVRSYLYPTDLVSQIFKVATSTATEMLEVGSRNPIRLIELASKISELTTNVDISSGDLSAPISEYFPRTQAKFESRVNLDDAICRWYEWITLNH
jgi:nucleoside-diphosphate-sugar epimerase